MLKLDKFLVLKGFSDDLQVLVRALVDLMEVFNSTGVVKYGVFMDNKANTTVPIFL